MVIVIDDFAVDSNTVQPKAKPAVPPVTPLYDDNTMYNTTVYPGKQVSAPSAAEQPVAYQAPIWESATQTYRDPESGLLWLDDGTPGGQWVSDAAYAAKKVSAYAPPPIEHEDAYDFTSGPITDADAYSQIMNPYVVSDIRDSTRWPEGRGSGEWLDPQTSMDDTLWKMLAPGTALSEELVAAGVLIPPPPNQDLGGPYLLNEIGRARYNTDQLNMYPYSDPARAYFESNPPITLNSGFMRSQDSPDKGTGANASDAGIRIGDRVRSDVFPHERAHQWQWMQMGHNDEQPVVHQEFVNNAYAALSDPSVPTWVANAIRRGIEHGSGKGLTVSYEVFATLAEAAAGRLAELPPYLRQYFDTLYTR